MFELITVSAAAKELKITERRVRLLLSQGRIHGFKNGYNVWCVNYPFIITPGKRGPDFHNFISRK